MNFKIGEKNVSGLDRIIRIVVGLALMGVGLLYVSPWLGYALALIGLLVLGTGIFETCTFYSILGINTKGK